LLTSLHWVNWKKGYTYWIGRKGMKHVTFNTAPFPELAEFRESLEFSYKGPSLARLHNERNSFKGTGERNKGVNREKKRNLSSEF
jgi:hypothetical protein